MPEALEIGLQLAAVLEYLHTRQPPVIFRDLKPANVMLTAPLHVSLIDFGIARHFKPGQSKDTLVIGTIGYLAPEGYGKGQTTPRSDIYSLSVTLHQMLSGEDPAEKPFHVAPLGAPVPPALAALVAEMVAMEEDRRPATMAEVRQRLHHLMDARAAATDVLPRGIAALSPTQPPDQSFHPSPSTALGPQPVQMPPIAPRAGGFSRRKVAIGLGLGALVVGAGVVGILKMRAQPVVNNPIAPTPAQPSDSTPVPPPTPTPGNVGSNVPGITPTAAPNTQGTVAYRPYRGQYGGIFAVAWSPLDGRTIASASQDSTVQVWDSVTQKGIASFLGATIAMGWSPDGRYIASIMQDNSVRVWNPQNGRVAFTYSRPQGGLARLGLLTARGRASPRSSGQYTAWSLAWSPDSQKVASSLGFQAGIQVWSVRNQQTLLSFGGATGYIALAWSPDGTRLLSGGDSTNVISLWDALAGRPLASYSGHTNYVTGLAWSPKGQMFASSSADGTVRVWASTGSLIYVYTGHSGGVTALAWSPDSRRIASASDDTTVQLWDATTGANVFVYRGHSWGVLSVAWSPDGKHLASGGNGNDESVQVWEAR